MKRTALPVVPLAGPGGPEIDGFLDGQLRHHATDGDELDSDPRVPESVRRAYRALDALATGGGKEAPRILTRYAGNSIARVPRR
jgi:hypothetical protein